MHILIAEDDAVSRRVLQTMLRKWGHEVVVTCDGLSAWQALQQPTAPHLAVLDWMMPGLDGIEVCQRVQAAQFSHPLYLILLTARGCKDDIVAGLQAGADDYLTKPFDPNELRARVHVGERILRLQSDLAARVRDLEDALTNVKQLQGLLPICCYCKRIRDDQNYWQQVESYVSAHSEAQFSHGVCPDCYEKVVRPELDELKREHAEPA